MILFCIVFFLNFFVPDLFTSIWKNFSIPLLFIKFSGLYPLILGYISNSLVIDFTMYLIRFTTKFAKNCTVSFIKTLKTSIKCLEFISIIPSYHRSWYWQTTPTLFFAVLLNPSFNFSISTLFPQLQNFVFFIRIMYILVLLTFNIFMICFTDSLSYSHTQIIFTFMLSSSRAIVFETTVTTAKVKM